MNKQTLENLEARDKYISELRNALAKLEARNVVLERVREVADLIEKEDPTPFIFRGPAPGLYKFWEYRVALRLALDAAGKGFPPAQQGSPKEFEKIFNDNIDDILSTEEAEKGR